jgi:adenosylcobinamide kinase/adenosylcobinamide-phosphate guanylyltransferase
MRILIVGGAGSGKSQYAESVACRLGGNGPKLYLATMAARDPESLARIQKHRIQRQDKGFETVERDRDLPGLTLVPEATILLEDLGNLVANELFLQEIESKNTLRIIDDGLAHLERQTRHLVVVGNDLFSDGCQYDGDTRRYLDLMAQLQNRLASRYDRVIEVVCGIPVVWKGEKI